MSETRTKDPSGTGESLLRELSDFSLVCGGPLYQFLRRTRLSGDALESARRRILALVVITWAPLLALSIAGGSAWGTGVALPFLEDFETNLRLLIAAPLLILAEVRVQKRLPPIVRQFVDNGLVRDEARPQFDAAVASTLRLRNSVVAELLMLVLVYGVGVPFVWSDQVALDIDSWYGTTVSGDLQPSYAGLWLGLVSMPMFQFLSLRWFFRLFIWARFLWQVARTRLRLEPTHPDRTAGLLFLSRTRRVFMLMPLAMGTVLSGMIANRILHTGAELLDFKLEILGTAALQVLLILGPLTVFYPQLRSIRGKGMVEYGALGQIYAREFNRKWIPGPHSVDEPLLGTPDIQSLADLHHGFEVVRGIRLVPFSNDNVLSLAVITLLPVAPLLLTTFSVDELVDRMLKALF